MTRLDINNFIPRSAMVRNTVKVYGLVVYIGKNTKIMKNLQQRIYKQSALDKAMNRYIFLVLAILFIFLLILAFFALVTQLDYDYEHEVLGKYTNPGLNFIYVILAYLLLMNIILPLSLVITLQILKIVQNFYLLGDDDFHEHEEDKHPLVNSVNLNDQLGQVKYILSDKTGTLTQNKMVAKYFQVLHMQMPLFEGEDKLKSQLL